jgi:hypothetical protein
MRIKSNHPIYSLTGFSQRRCNDGGPGSSKWTPHHSCYAQSDEKLAFFISNYLK